jgi:hypothetical protein
MRAALQAIAIAFVLLGAQPVRADPAARAEDAARRAEAAATRSEEAARRVEAAAERLERMLERFERQDAPPAKPGAERP